MRDQENKLDDILLDRLVDGELSDSEYRTTLSLLESQPDGWRRCALAFLEAQAWGREFRGVRNEHPAVPQVKVGGPRSASWLYLGAMAIACAASFLLAFRVATWLQQPSQLMPSAGDLTMQSQRGTPGKTEPTKGKPEIQFAGNSESEPLPVGRYQLVVDSESGTPQTVEMPVFSADDPRAGLLLDEYATMPRDLIRALQKNGNDVQRHRKWMPMQSSSGTPLYVPVDELQVTPVSNRSYR